MTHFGPVAVTQIFKEPDFHLHEKQPCQDSRIESVLLYALVLEVQGFKLQAWHNVDRRVRPN